MPISVSKKSNENADQLLVRFNKSSTRFVRGFRGKQHFIRNKSFLKRKIAALKREEYRAKRAARQWAS